MKKLRFWVPTSDGSEEYEDISFAEAIRLQKRSAQRNGCLYISDSEALADFIAIHWAIEVDE